MGIAFVNCSCVKFNPCISIKYIMVFCLSCSLLKYKLIYSNKSNTSMSSNDGIIDVLTMVLISDSYCKNF